MTTAPNPLQSARRDRLVALKKMTKREVFDIWCRTCLGPVHCASISEQRKSWMAEDIAEAELGSRAPARP